LRPAARLRPARTSLNQPTGPRRSFASIRVDLNQLRAAAHAHQATVNDAVLTAIGGALHRLLERRGERAERFVVSVPFSARRQASGGVLGNESGVIPLPIPAVGDPVRRLETVAEATRAAKRTPPGDSTALLGPLFRLLARLGLYRWFIDRQRLVHTFATNLHGPDTRLSLLGCPVTSIIPLSVATGDVTVSFAALSYAGTLSITINADPDACPDLPVLRQALAEEIGALAG
jgi:diacylglycerol O-acyltransferase